jgi:hypothetical protein
MGLESKPGAVEADCQEIMTVLNFVISPDIIWWPTRT